MTGRSAAGQAAGYHFQIQRALVSLLAGSTDAEVAIETLDDLVLDGENTRTFEQLKHSIRAGSLTDRSRPLWKALDAWMDLVDDGRLDDVRALILVATDVAPEGSSAAALRADDGRSVTGAEHQLTEVACEQPGAADTERIRKRFREMSARRRRALLSKIEVRDATADIGEFRDQLREQLGLVLPRAGSDEFLDKLVGWWERRAVDLLLGRRSTVSREEVAEEIARLRDQYSERTLPPPDQALVEELSDVVLSAYAGAPFVHQLELIATRDERVQLAVRDYHRAYAQRSRWLEQGVLAPDELGEWEDRLHDEWEHAWHRMLDNLEQTSDEAGHARAGKSLLDSLESSSLNALRDRADSFLRVGTLHGMADIRRIGWHPDFRARLETLIGAVIDGANTGAAFHRAAGGS